MEGAFDQIALGGSNCLGAAQRPIFQRVGVFTDHPFARAGRIQQHGVKLFRQGGAEDACVKMGEGDIADAAAADIGVQHLDAARRKFVGEDGAAVAHARRYLRGFRAGRGRHIHHPQRIGRGVKQRADRQHRARFLNVKQPAQMLRHAAQRQTLIVALNPEAFRAPGHRRQPPAIVSRLGEEIRYADFERVDADSATQRLLADGDKALQLGVIGQRGAHQVKKVRGEKIGHGQVPVETLRSKTGAAV